MRNDALRSWERGGALTRSQKQPLRAVTAEERAALELLSKASSARVDRVRRATALLAVADGGSFAAAARRAGLRSGPGVAGGVRRVNRRGPGGGGVAAGGGRGGGLWAGGGGRGRGGGGRAPRPPARAGGGARQGGP